MRIILASQSQRRKKLLQQLGFNFEVIPSSVNENIDETDPVVLVEKLAFAKASDVSIGKSNCLVIGSDTIVVLKEQILGKNP